MVKTLDIIEEMSLCNDDVEGKILILKTVKVYSHNIFLSSFFSLTLFFFFLLITSSFNIFHKLVSIKH